MQTICIPVNVAMLAGIKDILTVEEFLEQICKLYKNYVPRKCDAQFVQFSHSANITPRFDDEVGYSSDRLRSSFKIIFPQGFKKDSCVIDTLIKVEPLHNRIFEDPTKFSTSHSLEFKPFRGNNYIVLDHFKSVFYEIQKVLRQYRLL